MNNTFQIQVQGIVTGKMYEGEFSSKIPNAKDQALIAKHRAMLNGGFDDGLDPGTLNLHYRISYLRYTLTQFPDWWKKSDLGYELYDINVIDEVYGKVLKFETDWMTAVWGEQKEENDLREEAESR
jgi:hypothetical protein